MVYCGFWSPGYIGGLGSSESKGSLASMFGQAQQAAPEAPQSNRPKNLFNDVDTSGASITGDPKVDKTIEDQKNNCPPK